MKTWIEINNRIFEMEKVTEEQRTEEWKKEWNTLLDMKVAGIVKRKKYEIPKGKSTRKEGKRKEGKGGDVGCVSMDMGTEAPLLRDILDKTGEGATINVLPSHITQEQV